MHSARAEKNGKNQQAHREKNVEDVEVEEDDEEDVSLDKQYSEQEELGSQSNGEGCRCTEDDQ